MRRRRARAACDHRVHEDTRSPVDDDKFTLLPNKIKCKPETDPNLIVFQSALWPSSFFSFFGAENVQTYVQLRIDKQTH